MKLWHHDTIEALPRRQLLALHRNCCALRGRSWGRTGARNGAKGTFQDLVWYHWQVLRQMNKRGYRPDPRWVDPYYRGKRMEAVDPAWMPWTANVQPLRGHTEAFRAICVERLRALTGLDAADSVRLSTWLAKFD